MSWLRIDDSFVNHPKILELTDREFRVWLRVLCYCASYDTCGEVPLAAASTLGLDRKLVRKLTTARLLDEPSLGHVYVHNWNVYNPQDRTGKIRKRAQRSREAAQRHVTVTEPEDSDNDVTVTGSVRARSRPVPKDTRAVSAPRTEQPETISNIIDRSLAEADAARRQAS